ncbi:MAG: UvrB/UvrC motif-containing protein [Victivallales bacterium]
MLCEICKKNEATIHIQEIINSQKKALNICQDCAAKKNGSNGLFNGLNLADILYNISSNLTVNGGKATSKVQEPSTPQVPNVTCSKCGWSTTNFSERGRLGCANCYNVFRDILSLALKNMHKGTLHVGKHPGTRSSEDDEASRNAIEVMKMQKRLEDHILREEYEKAAELRDLIANLKSRNSKSKKQDKGQ